MKGAPKAKASEEASAPALHTLDDMVRELGKPSADVVDELFEDVTPAVLMTFGRRADSAVLYGAVPAFVSSVRDVWAKLKPSQRGEVVGYAEEFLPVLAHDAVALRAKHQVFAAQGSKVLIELARRKEAARLAFTEGRVLRDQGARMLRRVTRGKTDDASSLETSIGTASDAAKLSAGLTFVADEVERHLKGGTETRKRLMKRVKLDAAYVQRLRDAAARVVATDDAASAASRASVSQEELDQADGRVMHVVDWIYRAFKEANELDESIAVPTLGDLAPYFTTKRVPKDDGGEGGGEQGGGEGEPAAGGGAKPG